MVDDGSTDGTAAEVERWVAQRGTDAVRLLTLKENQGKGAAVGKVCCMHVHHVVRGFRVGEDAGRGRGGGVCIFMYRVGSL